MLQVTDTTGYEARFSGMGRLVGREGWARLRQSHVCIVGVGGVGSWAVEALARSGIGELTLIDLDDVCVSNTNRQLAALTDEVGKPKVEVLAKRVEGINPECHVHPSVNFFTAANADLLLNDDFDFLFDAIDNVANKCLLIAKCREKGIPIITAGGAGGRRDPTAIRVADLAFTSHDPLLQQVRKKLRTEFEFPSQEKAAFGVPCVFSPEPVVYPHSDGTVCQAREEGTDLCLNCESGYGTAGFVTGTFGFVAAAEIVRRLT